MALLTGCVRKKLPFLVFSYEEKVLWMKFIIQNQQFYMEVDVDLVR